MTGWKCFCILPDDVFGLRIQPQQLLFLSPALEEKEDLELHVGGFFPGVVTRKNKEQFGTKHTHVMQDVICLLAPPGP